MGVMLSGPCTGAMPQPMTVHSLVIYLYYSAADYQSASPLARLPTQMGSFEPYKQYSLTSQISLFGLHIANLKVV